MENYQHNFQVITEAINKATSKGVYDLNEIQVILEALRQIHPEHQAPPELEVSAGKENGKK